MKSSDYLRIEGRSVHVWCFNTLAFTKENDSNNNTINGNGFTKDNTIEIKEIKVPNQVFRSDSWHFDG